MPGIGWARPSSSGQSVQFFKFLCPPNYPTGLRGGLVNIRDPAGIQQLYAASLLERSPRPLPSHNYASFGRRIFSHNVVKKTNCVYVTWVLRAHLPKNKLQKLEDALHETEETGETWETGDTEGHRGHRGTQRTQGGKVTQGRLGQQF